MVFRIAEYHIGTDHGRCGSVRLARIAACIIIELNVQLILQSLIGLHDHILHFVCTAAQHNLSHICTAALHLLSKGNTLCLSQRNTNMGRHQDFSTKIFEFLNQCLLLCNHISIHRNLCRICVFKHSTLQSCTGVCIKSIHGNIYNGKACADSLFHQLNAVFPVAFIAVGNGHNGIIGAICDLLEGLIIAILRVQRGQMHVKSGCSISFHLGNGGNDIVRRRTFYTTV